MDRYILAIDQGTTSTRALIMNTKGEVLGQFQKLHQQYYPHKAWVEHDPEEIWHNTMLCCDNAILNADVKVAAISCIGITNQRETTILWNKHTGKPIYPAIVWQDRRTSDFCEQLKKVGLESVITEKSGLLLDPYFSASKIAWILDNVTGARKLAEANQLAFGTIDSFLLWRLTSGKVHATDITNASRTSLFNIITRAWDEELCRLFNIPMQILPEVCASNALFGETNLQFFGCSIPITGIIGDQQAAALGEGCFSAGAIKTTYGTGCFMLMNIGETVKLSKNRLLTTVLYQINDKVNYALEGSIFIAGAGVQWLRDQLGLIQNAKETELMAAALQDNGGVYFVPALSGLGAPYWQSEATGTIYGMTLDTKKDHLVRAMLEAIGFQTRDLVEAMCKDADLHLQNIKVDGGMVENHWLMQWLADILGLEVKKCEFVEITAYGAGLLAALGVGIFSDLRELQIFSQTNAIFAPSMSNEMREKLYAKWLIMAKNTSDLAKIVIK